MPDQTTHEGGSGQNFKLHKKLFVFFVLFVLSAFTEGFDSFGLASLHDRQAADLSSIVEVPLAGLHASTAKAPDLVTAFLFDDDARRQFDVDTSYLPYDKLADVLAPIVAAQPRAIFLDFSYGRYKTDDAGAGLDKLIRVLDDAHSRGIRVYSGSIGGNEKLDPLRQRLALVSISWPADHGLNYPFVGDADYLGNSNAQALTAAPAIYRDLCESQDLKNLTGCRNSGVIDQFSPTSSSAASPLPSPQAGSVREAPEPMFLVYEPYVAASIHASSLSYEGSAACKRQPRGDQFVRWGIARSVLQSVNGDNAIGHDKCVAVPHFSLARTQIPDFGNGTGSAPDPLIMQAYVKGKVVMIGDGLGKDVFDAPIFGQLPGVMQHALALRTLLRDGEDYQRLAPAPHLAEPHGGGNFSLSLTFFIEQLLALCVILCVTVATTEPPQQNMGSGSSGRLWKKAGLALLPIVLAALVIWVEAAMHWPLANYISIAATAGGVIAITELDRLLSKRWPVMLGVIAFCIALAIGTYLLLDTWLVF